MRTQREACRAFLGLCIVLAGVGCARLGPLIPALVPLTPPPPGVEVLRARSGSLPGEMKVRIDRHASVSATLIPMRADSGVALEGQTELWQVQLAVPSAEHLEASPREARMAFRIASEPPYTTPAIAPIEVLERATPPDSTTVEGPLRREYVLVFSGPPPLPGTEAEFQLPVRYAEGDDALFRFRWIDAEDLSASASTFPTAG